MGLSYALVEPVDLGLHRMELRDNGLTGKAGITRQPFIAAIRYGRNQLLQTFMPLRCHQSELGQVGTHVWTAPTGQGILLAFCLRSGASHVSGLFVRCP